MRRNRRRRTSKKARNNEEDEEAEEDNVEKDIFDMNEQEVQAAITEMMVTHGRDPRNDDIPLLLTDEVKDRYWDLHERDDEIYQMHGMGPEEIVAFKEENATKRAVERREREEEREEERCERREDEEKCRMLWEDPRQQERDRKEAERRTEAARCKWLEMEQATAKLNSESGREILALDRAAKRRRLTTHYFTVC